MRGRMTFLLLGLLAHAIADFVLQPENVVRRKERCALGAHLHHAGVTLLCHIAAFHAYGLRAVVLMGAGMSLAHAVLDGLKALAHARLSRVRRSPVKGLGLFMADQLAHAITIVAAWELAPVELLGSTGSFYGGVLLPRTGAALAPAFAALGVSLDRVLVVVVAYVLVVFGGAAFVRQVLDTFCEGVDQSLSTSAGRYIGMAERTLMLTLVLVNAFSSLAFVLTAKSLARFRELSDMRFAEYYLIGTLASASAALFAGIAVRAVLNIA